MIQHIDELPALRRYINRLPRWLLISVGSEYETVKGISTGLQSVLLQVTKLGISNRIYKKNDSLIQALIPGKAG